MYLFLLRHVIYIDNGFVEAFLTLVAFVIKISSKRTRTRFVFIELVLDYLH